MNARYVIVDPLGNYPRRLMEFAHRVGLDAVAVFSNEMRAAGWRYKWRDQLGEMVVEDHCVGEETPIDVVAEAILGGLGEVPLVGIVPWDEISIQVGAELGARLGLGWNPPEVIERCRDKHVMKRWLRERSAVRINASAVVSTAEEAAAFQAALGRWPIVVKPTMGAGSEDVHFAHGPHQLLWSCQRVSQSGSGEVLLEEYVDGDEFVVNGMVDREGSFLPTDVWVYDKRPSHGIPNLYFQTIKVGSHEAPFRVLVEYARDVVAALGVVRAPIHMEVKLDERGPCLIEVGARFAGGNQPMLASKLHGRSLFELGVCHYLGDVDLAPTDVDFRRYDAVEARVVSGVQPFDLPRVNQVWGRDEVEALPSFDGFGKLYSEGARVPMTRDLDTKSYEVYLRHPDPRRIEHDAAAVRYLLHYE